MFCSSLQLTWDFPITPLWSLEYSLTLIPPSIDLGSHNPPLSGSMWDLTIHLLYGRCGISQSIPFRVQRPHTFSNRCKISQSPLFRPNILIDTRSSHQSIWNLTFYFSNDNWTEVDTKIISELHDYKITNPSLNFNRLMWRTIP